MADERQAARPPDPRTPVPPRTEPGKAPGWRVDPPPDGRGAPKGKPPMMPFSWRRYLTIIAVLLVVN